jgi:hypothetical protein
MLYPVLPVFLMQTLNASGSVVGLIDGVVQATQNIVQDFFGWLSDKLQKRKSAPPPFPQTGRRYMLHTSELVRELRAGRAKILFLSGSADATGGRTLRPSSRDLRGSHCRFARR